MLHTSPDKPVAIPEVSLSEFVFRDAAKYADRPALVDGPTGRTLTFAQLTGAIRKAAAGLAAKGFGKGDVLAIYSPNLPEYAIVFHAVASLGGINTTINPLYTVDELTTQLKDAKARWMVTIGMFLDKARQAATAAGIKEVFTLDGAPESTPFSDLLKHGDTPPAVAIDSKKDLVALPYSSGTTGLPKGVMLTHHNLVANLCQITGTTDPYMVNKESTVIGLLPFFHIYGMTVIMNFALYRGAKVVTLPKFDLEPFLQLMQNHKVTHGYLVPPIVLALGKHPLVGKYDLSALKIIMCGAAPLGEGQARETSERLGCIVRQGYGLTETSPVTHMSPSEPHRLRQASIGFSLPNTETMVMDIATGKPLGPRQEGEIWVRGPQVMRGYLNRPQDTALVIDKEGWFHTGDIGYTDEDGYFYIVDRLKELIKYKGNQVAPAELEALLLTHPAVMDAAVIPSPDEEAGEVPKAFVVLKGKAEGSELMEYVAGKVAPHKKIRRLEFIDQIPKSASGKILRRLLVQREREAMAGRG